MSPFPVSIVIPTAKGSSNNLRAQSITNSSSHIYGRPVFAILQAIELNKQRAKEKFFMLYYTGRKLKQITKLKLEF